MDAIELLVNEHGLIRQYLDNLSVAAEKLESGERPSEVFFKKAVEFAKKFTEKFHHFKKLSNIYHYRNSEKFMA
jgi:hemerythrin-like domain-containing protein